MFNFINTIFKPAAITTKSDDSRKTIKLLIVANNCPWSSWQSKIDDLYSFFKDKIDLQITINHTQYTDIPFTPYLKEGQYYGVDQNWYDAHISSEAKEYDIVLLVLNNTQWRLPNYARGWRGDKNNGPVELQLSADENENIYQNGVLKYGTFQHFAEHEIIHALFMLTGQTDTTHAWDYDKKDLSGALNDISFPSKKIRDTTTIVQKITSSLVKPATGGDLLNKMCLAIQEHEGYFKPGERADYPNGSISYRNNNPGNLRYFGQIGSTGQRNGFAVFKDYQSGMNALRSQILLVANNKSRVYPKNCTLLQFFRIYAPTFDNNKPDIYAKVVADKMGVTIDFSLSKLI